MRKIFTYKVLGFAIVCILILQSQVSVAQWTVDVIGTVKKEETKKRMEGAVITIKRNGTNWKTLNPPANGKFEAALEPDAIYMIEFSKFGHVTKKIEISTKNVPPEDAKYGFDFPMEVVLFEKMEGLDVSILDKPIAKVAFDTELGIIDYDANYTKSIKKELDRLKDELAQKLKDESKNRLANQAKYDDAIAAGDKAYNAGKWAEAKPHYEKALSIFSDESYPDFQLGDISDKMAEFAEANKRYNSAIQKADAAFKARDYDKAITSYEYASSLKEDEKYPKDKIKEVKTIQSNAKKVDKEYNEVIAEADQLILSRDYEAAKQKLNRALELKDYEQYPKDKLKDIEKIIAEQAAKEKQYTDAIKEADAAFKTKEYDKAVAAYQKALVVKPSETYPQTKIDESKRLKQELKELEEKYVKLIADGDAALTTKDYANAKINFEQAAALKKTEKYPKDKLVEIKALMDAAAQLDAKYANFIKVGDNTLAAKDFEASKAAFVKAKELKPAEQYPKDKLAEIDLLIAELAKAEAEKKAKDAAYTKLITAADALLASNKLEEAKTKYNEALGVKAEEQYPKDQLKTIDNALAALAKEEAEKKAKEEKYLALIAEGDNLLSAKNYDEAKTKYNEALTVKSEEKYPKDKLKEIESALAALAKEEAEKKAKEEKYLALVAEGDNLLSAKSYDEAKTKYNKALTVKSEEQYPKDKLKEIEITLAEIAKKKAEEEAARVAAALIESKYLDAIAAADKSLSSKKYEAAKLQYNEALTLKKEEQYPKDKLAEIELALAAIAKKKAEEEASKMALAEKEAKYKETITLADNALGAKNYDQAKIKYNEALGIKSEEQYPQDQLKIITDVLAALAKEDAEKKATQGKYSALILEGDNLFGAKNYDQAKIKYNEALVLKSEEKYPKDKLKEIDNILAEIARKKAEDEAAKMAGAEREAKYIELITAADKSLVSKKYEAAKTKYNEAVGIKSEEQYPKDKLKEIESILAEIVRKKAEDEAAKMAGAEKDAKYKEAITLADNAFGYENFDQAKIKYNEALTIKPNEQYPKDKLMAVEAALANLAKKNAEDALAIESERKKKEYFDALITEADAEFSNTKYNEATAKYIEALEVFPGKKYPTDKIKEINNILANIKADKANASRDAAELEKKYLALITSADNSFGTKKYSNAKNDYSAALALKNSEIYPKKQLAEIDRLLAEIAEKENLITLSANAKKQKEADYNALISLADNAVTGKAYKKALSNYQSALGIMPNKAYPKEKIDEVKKILSDLAAKEQNNKEAMFAEKKKRKAYDKLIYDGDRSMKLEDYSIAKAKFNDALALYSNEKYPKDKLNLLIEILKKKSEPKEIVVSKGSMSGGRATINRDKEREIEERMAMLQGKRNVKKVEKLHEEKETYNSQEEIRVSSGIERTVNAKKELANKEDGNKAIIERGNKFHKDNDESLKSQKELLNKSELDFKNKGDKIRTENKSEIDAIQLENAKKSAQSQKRAEDMAVSFDKYKADLLNEEEIRISKSVDRRDDNEAELDKVEEEIAKMKKEKSNNYELNIEKLAAFKQNIKQFETNIIKRGDESRLENDKINKQQVANIKNNMDQQNKRYYADLVDVNIFKDGVTKFELANQKESENQRIAANKEIVNAMRNLGNAGNSYEKKYQSFKIKLDEEKELNNTFLSDLQLLEQKKIAKADAGLENFYRGEKKQRDDGELAAKYPQGITEETSENGNSIVIKRTKVTGTNVDIYERVFYSWGGTYFYKNNVSITQSLWDKESID